MKLKYLTLIMVVTLLFAFSVNVVSGVEASLLVDYTEFNSTTDTKHSLNKTLSSMYMINITDTLTFNTTTNATASIVFYHADNVSQYVSFTFCGVTDYMNFTIASQDTTLLNNATYVSKVSVWFYETNASVYIDNVSKYNMSSFEVYNTKYLNCSGIDYLAEAGNVTIYIGSLPTGKQISYQINQIMPILISFAVIIMVVNMLDKMTKKLSK